MNRRLALKTVGFLTGILLVTSACDSKSRGEQQNASRSDEEALTEKTSETPPSTGPAAEEAIPTPEEVRAPERADLLAYTEGIEGEGPLVASLQTTEGTIRCRLFEDVAPMTVANFVGLARGLKAWRDPQSDHIVTDKPLYDGVIFHRVIPGFLIQSGDPTGTGTGGPGYAIPDEIDAQVSHDAPGTLSMANRGPDAGGSQFFITEVAAPHLDGRHTIFGRCKDLDVVKSIARMPAGPENRPEHPPKIEEISFERRSIGVAAPSDGSDQSNPDAGADSSDAGGQKSADGTGDAG